MKGDVKNPMEYALRYLGNRARSVREVEDYLDGKQFGESDIMATVDRLLEVGYLGDEKFAAEFVESRLRTKPFSRNALLRQLLERKVSKDIAKAAIAEISDEDELKNCYAVMEGFWFSLSGLPQADRRRRVCSRALARGFGYDTVVVCRNRLFGGDCQEELEFEDALEFDDEIAGEE